MPFIRNNPIPPETNVELNINNFIGGLNNVTSPYELEISESPDMMNVWCYNAGVIENRAGTLLYDDISIDDKIINVFKYSNTQDKSLILCSENKTYVYYKSDVSSNSTITELKHIDSSIPNVSSGFQYEDSFYFINGDGYYEFDGTYIWKIIQPTEEDSVGMNTNEELMTKSYQPTQQQKEDTYLGSNNISMFEKCKHIILRPNKQIIYGSMSDDNNNIVYYTDFDNPYYVPVNQWIPPISHDGDYITGIECFNDVIVIFKHDTIFALYGSSAQLTGDDLYNLKVITSHTGTSFNKTIQKVGNSLYFLGTDGKFYSLYDVRTDYQKMLTACISDTIDIRSNPINLHTQNIQKAYAIYYDDLYLCVLDDKVLVYKPRFSWSVFNHIDPDCFILWDTILVLFKQINNTTYPYRWSFKPFYITETFDIVQYNQEFSLKYGYLNDISDALIQITGTRDDDTITGSSFSDVIGESTEYEIVLTSEQKQKYSTNSEIKNTTFKIKGAIPGDTLSITYLSMVSYNDYGESYESYWKSKDLDFGITYRQKQIRNLFILADTYKWFNSIITLTTYVDYIDVTTSQKLVNTIPLWGIAKFGDKFINKNIIKPQKFIVNKRGNIISFKLESNNLNNPFRVFSINGNINIRPK